MFHHFKCRRQARRVRMSAGLNNAANSRSAPAISVAQIKFSFLAVRYVIGDSWHPRGFVASPERGCAALAAAPRTPRRYSPAGKFLPGTFLRDAKHKIITQALALTGGNYAEAAR